MTLGIARDHGFERAFAQRPQNLDRAPLTKGRLFDELNRWLQGSAERRGNSNSPPAPDGRLRHRFIHAKHWKIIDSSGRLDPRADGRASDHHSAGPRLMR